MRSSRCVFNTATALHRVFISPIERSNRPFLLHNLSTPLRRIPTALKPISCLKFRTYATSKAEKSRLPRDDEIKSWSVYLVAGDGTLSDGAQNTYDILSSIDRKTHSLVVVSPGSPDGLPICKIMDKKAMREAEKAKASAARKAIVTTKTIELNWAIGGNDLAHRLQRVKDFLERGHRVEVTMAGKKKGRKATEEEAESLVRRVRDVVGECEGARENKPMEGKLLGTATIYLEGKRKRDGEGMGDGQAEAVANS